jgi:hypothetical protein
MEVRSGTARSQADLVRGARNAAAHLDTQPLAAAAPPADEQPALGPGSLFSDRYTLGQVIGSGRMSTGLHATTGAPAAR